jgi:hypothetical protein
MTMKKTNVFLMCLFVSTLTITMASCSSSTNEAVHNAPAETSETTEAVVAEAETKDALEADALRMGELACASKAIMAEFQAKNIDKAEMDKQVAPLNVEMAAINERFEGSYKNDPETLKRFQTVFQSVFGNCP